VKYAERQCSREIDYTETQGGLAERGQDLIARQGIYRFAEREGAFETKGGDLDITCVSRDPALGVCRTYMTRGTQRFHRMVRENQLQCHSCPLQKHLLKR